MYSKGFCENCKKEINTNFRHTEFYFCFHCGYDLRLQFNEIKNFHFDKKKTLKLLRYIKFDQKDEKNKKHIDFLMKTIKDLPEWINDCARSNYMMYKCKIRALKKEEEVLKNLCIRKKQGIFLMKSTHIYYTPKGE